MLKPNYLIWLADWSAGTERGRRYSAGTVLIGADEFCQNLEGPITWNTTRRIVRGLRNREQCAIGGCK